MTSQLTKASKSHRPTASMSMDLDNQWSYMKTHGNPDWRALPSYLPILIPQVIAIFARLNLKITFFIVGQDAAQVENHEALRLITQEDHEVGNHSYHHEPWLHLYSKDRIETEISETQSLIFDITGHRPVGFRGPGFSWSADLLEVLTENHYLYDASSLPTFLGPLARLYYFWTADLSSEEKNTRKALFGSLQDGFRPLKPFRWRLDSGRHILEIPVTTIPVVKTPFHLSYLLYLSRFSPLLMVFYLHFAIGMCKLTGTEPSFLLHPLDLLSGDQVDGLAFFPGMDIDSRTKAARFTQVIATIAKFYRITTMHDHAQECLNRKIRTQTVTSI